MPRPPARIESWWSVGPRACPLDPPNDSDAMSCTLACLALLTAAQAADRYVHPGGAFSLVPPAGCAVRAFVDELGTPFHVVTDDLAAAHPAQIASGQWLIAVPIPTDEELDAAAIAPLVCAHLVAREPGLNIGAAPRAGRLGSLAALVFPVTGRRMSGAAWEGELHLAVQADSYLVVHQGGPPEQRSAWEPRYAASLATLAAPLPIRPVRDPRNAKALGADDARRALLACTPRVEVKARKDVKDPRTQVVAFGSGTGFVIHPAGWVVTNRHVVESYAGSGFTRLCYDPVELHFDASVGQAPVVADVVAVSQAWDLALLKLRGERAWPSVPLADPAEVAPGHRVLVAGWPEPDTYGRERATVAEGAVLGLERDSRGRALKVEHDAFTRPGSSGGPVFDLELGAVVAAHYVAVTPRALVGGVWQELPGGYKGGVPVARIVWEFPQVAADWADPARGLAERRALVAFHLLQERFGAAFLEAGRALAEDPADGLTNAFAYRMYAMQLDTERAQAALTRARKRPESSFLVVLLAAQTALENSDPIESHRWCAQAFQAGGPTNPLALLQHVKAQIASGGQADQFLAMTRTAFGRVPVPELESLTGIAAVTRYLATYNVVSVPPASPPSQQLVVDATVALERAIELWPARAGVSWAHLALVHAVDGRGREAEECRARALRSSPTDPFTRLTVAHLDLLNGDFRRAREQIGEAQAMRATQLALFLAGWANILEAREVAKTGDRTRAGAFAELGSAQVSRSTEGPARQLWWRGYSHQVSSRLLGR